LALGGRPGHGDFVIGAVARLIEQPSALTALPTSVRDGDFEQMVRAALRLTKPGMAVIPIFGPVRPRISWQLPCRSSAAGAGRHQPGLSLG
jgi:hypothetical protein